MLRPVGRTQPEVLDIDLMSIFAGVKEALDDLGEEGRTKTLPIEWRGCYVFSVERIENIETWDKSPSNIGATPLESSGSFSD